MLENLLSKKRTTIVAKWFSLILDTYPADTSRFLRQEKDRFINPVGSTISQGIETLYNELIHGMNSNELYTAIDSIVRVRSVQDFSPSQAIGFIPLLKRVIREELQGEIQDKLILDELLPFELRIDQLTLLAFDVYMKCREDMFEIRVNEVKAQKELALKLLERTNRMVAKLSQDGDLKDGPI